MPTFTYTAKDGEGEQYERTVEVQNRFAIYDIVRKEGGTIVSIEKPGEGIALTSFFDIEAINAFISRVTTDNLVNFSRNLSTMIGAGLPVSRGLTVMDRQTKNPKFRKILGEINEKIRQGVSLHAALAEYPRVFPPFLTAMVRAGEESGKLSDVLHIVSEQLERSSELKKKIRGAMIYPAIVITAMFGIGVLMMIFVVPTLTATFESFDAELPVSTKIIIALSDFLSNHTIVALGLLAAVVASVVVAARTPQGSRAIEFILLRIPVIGTLVRETNSARTTRTMSSLLSSGVDVVQAITITRDVVQNSFYREVLKGAEDAIQKGDPIAKVFRAHEDLYPPLCGEMIAVGEETGQLTDMLQEIALFYESEVIRKTEDMSKVIEPFLMIIVGAGVGFFALSMITPIYSLTESF